MGKRIYQGKIWISESEVTFGKSNIDLSFLVYCPAVQVQYGGGGFAILNLPDV